MLTMSKDQTPSGDTQQQELEDELCQSNTEQEPMQLGVHWHGKTQDPVISWAIVEEFLLEKLVSKFQHLC